MDGPRVRRIASASSPPVFQAKVRRLRCSPLRSASISLGAAGKGRGISPVGSFMLTQDRADSRQIPSSRPDLPCEVLRAPVSYQTNPHTENVVELTLGVFLAEPPTVAGRRIPCGTSRAAASQPRELPPLSFGK